MEGLPTNLCVTPRRKRTWTPSSVTNAYTNKRRRVSLAAVDLKAEAIAGPSSAPARVQPSGDRFISSRPEIQAPLNITPRTRRIANVFGLIDERVLRFTDITPSVADSSDYSSLRTNFAQLLTKTSKVASTSCVANLGARKQFVLALDGPGVPPDPFAYPLTWSHRNQIAVACGKDVYYQDLDSRVIKHLCKVTKTSQGRPTSVQWSTESPSEIAVGTTLGSIQLFDAGVGDSIREWREENWSAVGGMDWRGAVLAAGADGGTVEFYDARDPLIVTRLEQHRSKVHGVKFSPDGNHLATSDQNGVVYIWDVRMSRPLGDCKRVGGRIKHGAPVKALAWCPWQPDLLATGSTYPDGKIRVFSTKATSPIAAPVHALALHTAVTSLQWSPHAKELLSTHGTSWDPRAPRTALGRPVALPTPLTNSITVHAWPSARRLLSVTAHAGAVGHSCLSPDGTSVFTICPAEEAMKMWKVWSAPELPARASGSFSGRFAIR
ncbi:WD40 repeat-like protein [Phanerochaete sordida]|uniref:WD40 repeat-like protein n=1 Tax=Phanerochaete sordida TaxID=48140 RepID=A0A9P3G6I1_9APHY|nr:WD40 repeat-like protein [Phanerochaete sordida]